VLEFDYGIGDRVMTSRAKDASHALMTVRMCPMPSGEAIRDKMLRSPEGNLDVSTDVVWNNEPGSRRL